MRMTQIKWRQHINHACMTVSPVLLFVFIADIPPKLSSKKGPCHLSLYFPLPLGSYQDIAAVSCNFVEGTY